MTTGLIGTPFGLRSTPDPSRIVSEIGATPAKASVTAASEPTGANRRSPTQRPVPWSEPVDWSVAALGT